MSKILIAGGTGLIGNAITKLLLDKGHEVAFLSRKENLTEKIPRYRWSFEEDFIDPRALDGVAYLINLAGAPIADRPWTKQRRALIINSRVQGNKLIASHIRSKKLQLKKYISASAIGYYGDRGTEKLTEQSTSGDGFLAECCIAWEEAINMIDALGTPTTTIRVGIVLSNDGGALPKIMLTAKFGLGSYFGNGEQIYSWVHINDIAKLFVWALENDVVVGTYNGTAPGSVDNKTLVKKIMDVKGGISLPVPAFLLKTAMGELSTALLNSSDVYPKNAMKDGFEFQFPKIDAAIKNLLKS